MGSEFTSPGGKGAAKAPTPAPPGRASITASPRDQYTGPADRLRERLAEPERDVKRESASGEGLISRMPAGRQSVIQRTPLFADASRADVIQRQTLPTKTIQVRFDTVPVRGALIRVIDGKTGRQRGEDKITDDQGDVEVSAAPGDVVVAQKITSRKPASASRDEGGSGSAFGSSATVGEGKTVTIKLQQPLGTKGSGRILNTPVEAYLIPGEGDRTQFVPADQATVNELTKVVPAGDAASISLGGGGKLILRFEPPIVFEDAKSAVLSIEEHLPFEAFSVAFGNSVRRNKKGKPDMVHADAFVSVKAFRRQSGFGTRDKATKTPTGISIPRESHTVKNRPGTAYEWVEIRDAQGAGSSKVRPAERQPPDEPGIDITRVHARRAQANAMHIYLDASGSMLRVERAGAGDAVEQSLFFNALQSISNDLLPPAKSSRGKSADPSIKYQFNYFLGTPGKTGEGVQTPKLDSETGSDSKTKHPIVGSLADARARLEALRKIVTARPDSLTKEQREQRKALREKEQPTPLATTIGTGAKAAVDTRDPLFGGELHVLVLITDGVGEGKEEAIRFARRLPSTGINKLAIELIAYNIPANDSKERIDFFQYDPGSAFQLSTYEARNRGELGAILRGIRQKYGLSITDRDVRR